MAAYNLMLFYLFKFFLPLFTISWGSKRIVKDPGGYVNQYFHYVLLHNKPPQNSVAYNKDVLFLIILNCLGSISALCDVTEITHVATFYWGLSLPLVLSHSWVGYPSFSIAHLTSIREYSTISFSVQALIKPMLANVPLPIESHMAKLSVNKQNDFIGHKYWKAWSLGNTTVAIYPIQFSIQGKISLKHIDNPWMLWPDET